MNRKMILVVLSVTVASCTGQAPKHILPGRQQSAPTEVEVRVMPCSGQPMSKTVCYVGTVQASKMTVITAPFPGTLEKLEVREGQLVKKGDVLATMSSASVQSSYDVAKAALDYAEDGYSRALKLYESGSVSDSKMAEIESRLRQASASYQAASQALEDMTMKAPYDGVVDMVYANAGEQLTAAGRIARIVDARDVEVHFGIPENDYRHASVGQSLRVAVPATGREFAARLSTKGVVASQPAHNYECVITGVPDGAAVPGMACKVYMEQRSESGIVVPSSSVMTDGRGRYVWVLESGRAGRRYVTVNGYAGSGVLIGSGLGAQDTVITEGGHKVSDGLKVKALWQD